MQSPTCVIRSMSGWCFSTAVMQISTASSRTSGAMSQARTSGYFAILLNASMSTGAASFVASSVSADIVLYHWLVQRGWREGITTLCKCKRLE